MSLVTNLSLTKNIESSFRRNDGTAGVMGQGVGPAADEPGYSSLM